MSMQLFLFSQRWRERLPAAWPTSGAPANRKYACTKVRSPDAVLPNHPFRLRLPRNVPLHFYAMGDTSKWSEVGAAAKTSRCILVPAFLSVRARLGLPARGGEGLGSACIPATASDEVRPVHVEYCRTRADDRPSA